MGALLLEKNDPPKKTAGRLIRTFVVFFVGSLGYYIYHTQRNGTTFSLKEFLVNLPQTHITNAYWYLYLYLALLCMLPILQKLAKALTQRQLEYLLFFSLVICGTPPLVYQYFPFLQFSSDFTAGLIGPYIGQVLLGYYIERYVPMTKRVFRFCSVTFVLLIAIQVAGTFHLYIQDSSSYLALDNRTLITITGSAASFYICVKYIFGRYPVHPKLKRTIVFLGSLTFGIYLLGDMMIVQSGPVYSLLRENMHPFIAMIIWELFIFAACALITAGLRLIPAIRKWV